MYSFTFINFLEIPWKMSWSFEYTSIYYFQYVTEIFIKGTLYISNLSNDRYPILINFITAFQSLDPVALIKLKENSIHYIIFSLLLFKMKGGNILV